MGRRLLMNTQAQGMLFLSGDEMQPLRDVLSELIRYDEVSRHLVSMVSGLDIRYEADGGDHPLLGMRMPHQELVRADGKTSTTELLHPARGVLLDIADDAEVREAATGWSDRVDIVTASSTTPRRRARCRTPGPCWSGPTDTWPGSRPAAAPDSPRPWTAGSVRPADRPTEDQ